MAHPPYNSLILADDRGESHDDGGQGTLHMLVDVASQLLHTGHNLRQDGVCAIFVTQVL